MMALQRLRLTAWDRGIVLLLILTLLFGGMSSELFLTGDNLNFVISDVSEVLLIAFPMALLIIVRDIDLSVASSLTLASAAITRDAPISTTRAEWSRRISSATLPQHGPRAT